MKLIYLSGLLAALTLAACSDSATDPGTGSSDQTMTARVDGRSLTLPSVSYTPKNIPGTFGIFGYTEIIGNREEVGLDIDTITAPGTFTIGGASSGATGSYSDSRSGTEKEYRTSTAVEAGTVTVTEFSSTRARGTFRFVARNKANAADTVVVEGSFNAERL